MVQCGKLYGLYQLLSAYHYRIVPRVVSVVVDLASVSAHEADECSSDDLVACAVDDCVEDAAEMWEYRQRSVKTVGTACPRSCLNII